MSPEQFSQGIEAAYREALQGADAIRVQADRLREEAEIDRDAARAARQKAEAEGERLAQEHFASAAGRLEEAARAGLLRELVQKHLAAGRTSEEICAWLDVSPEFVDALTPRPAAPAMAPPHPDLPPNARVGTTQEGRSGTVWFESSTAKFDLWWEFAGGNALVIVDLPTPEQWEAQTKLPSDLREIVAAFIGEQLVAQQAPGGSFVIGHDVLTLYSGRRPR